MTRAFNNLIHDARLWAELSAAGPQAVYGALLSYARTKNYKPGWCAHAFKEIFGVWPSPQDRCGEPDLLPTFPIEEWVKLRKKRKLYSEADKPAMSHERIVPEEGRSSWLVCKSSKFMDDEQIRSAIDRIPLSWRRDEVLKSLHNAGPQAVYAGLLHYARAIHNGESAIDWVCHEFEEVFGVEPSSDDTVELGTLPDILIEDIEEWVAVKEDEVG